MRAGAWLRTGSRAGTLIRQTIPRNNILEARMRIFWAAAAAMLVCGAARAEGPMPSPANGDAAVGVGVICNTSEEARQFADLRSHGAAPDQAVQGQRHG